MEDNADVLIRSLPKEWTVDEIKTFIAEKMSKTVDEIFGTNLVSASIDNRPEPVNSNGQQAIFTCKSKEVAEQIVATINLLKLKFEEKDVK
jgi:hypothetical protein